MKIQLASDLHLELLENRFPNARIIEPAPGADLLVLAGDIHGAAKAVDAFRDWPVPVLYVAGNHEFYQHSWEQTRLDIRAACAGTNIHFLDNDGFVFGGVRFLGCTLWTDFKIVSGLSAGAQHVHGAPFHTRLQALLGAIQLGAL